MACTTFLGDRRVYTCVRCNFHAERNDTALVVEIDREGREVLLGLHIDRHLLVTVHFGRT